MLSDQPKLSYAVMVEQASSNQWIATVFGGWDCRATGESRDDAIAHLEQMIRDRLAKADLSELEIDNPFFKNPWVEMAGKYEDDPDFDEVLDYIAAYRRELDAEMEQENRQLDATDAV